MAHSVCCTPGVPCRNETTFAIGTCRSRYPFDLCFLDNVQWTYIAFLTIHLPDTARKPRPRLPPLSFISIWPSSVFKGARRSTVTASSMVSKQLSMRTASVALANSGGPSRAQPPLAIKLSYQTCEYHGVTRLCKNKSPIRCTNETQLAYQQTMNSILFSQLDNNNEPFNAEVYYLDCILLFINQNFSYQEYFGNTTLLYFVPLLVQMLK